MNRWAAGAFMFYLIVSWLAPERFPFSRFYMFSWAESRETAVPVFLADGVEAAIERYESFSGVSGKDIAPAGIPTAMLYRLEEEQRWVSSHQAPTDLPRGPIACQFGFEIISKNDSGGFRSSLKIVAQGRAYPRAKR